MVNKLTKLYNTMMLIETKGENTKTMAACLNYVQQLVEECAAKEASKAEQMKKEGESHD